MRITFDTNSLMDLVKPKPSQRPALQAAAVKVRDALADGVLQGFFSETLVTLEGVQRHDRQEVFGTTRAESRITSTSADTFNISVGVKQDRKPLDPEFSEMIQRAKRHGLRALRSPARMGWIRIADEDGTFFAPDGRVDELLARMDKVNEMATTLARRGVGQVRAIALGREFVDCESLTRPTLWCEGLSGASRKRVVRAIAEWSDGDSIASHYGYGNDLFCSEDAGRNASAPSVLDESDRQWLSGTFGVRFTTLSELAEMLGA